MTDNTINKIRGVATVGLLMWALGGAASLIAGIAMAYTSSTSAKVDSLSNKEVQDNNIVIQRVSTVEAHYQDIDSRLTRIENKLDKLSQ